MPRIRTFKPEYFSDEKIGPLAAIVRLVFLGLISMADDAGRIIDNLKTINAFIFPYTDDDAAEALVTLHRLERIRRGKSANGLPVIQIVNWHHQKIDKPNHASCLPQIEGDTEDAAARHKKHARGAGAAPPRSADVPSSEHVNPIVETSPNVPRHVDDTSTPHSSSSISSSITISTSSSSSSSSGSSEDAGGTTARRLASWRLQAAANAGFLERYGKKQKQLLAQPKMVDELRAAEVDPVFAIRAVYECAVTFAPEEPPTSLGYFTKHVIERWNVRQRSGLQDVPVQIVTDASFSPFESESVAHARAGDAQFRAYCERYGLPWNNDQDAAE